MREVWSDPAAAAARGARAQARRRGRPSARRRLARSLARGSSRIAHRSPLIGGTAGVLPGCDLEQRLAFDLSGLDGRGGPRGAARRALFRALSPYTASERKLDEALAAAIRRLQLELASDRSARSRDVARAARTDARIAALEEAVAELLRRGEEADGGA